MLFVASCIIYHALLFASVAQAQFNLSAASLELPSCAAQCSTQKLTAAKCALANIQDCLCKNTTLQSELFVCTQAACSLKEQFVSAKISQNKICYGVSQPSRQKEVIRKIVIISAVTFPCIFLRGFSRYYVTSFWWDDWIILLSGILLIPMSFIPIYNATKGFGSHLWDVPPENIMAMLKLYYVSTILYTIVERLIKVSILLFYLRIFPSDRFRRVVKITILAITLETLGFTLAIIFQCNPIHAVWDLSMNAKCISSKGLVYSGAAVVILEDLLIISFPIPQLAALQLSLKKRVALILMFAMGSFACIASIYRVKWLVEFQLHSLDATWVNVDAIIWSVIEVYAAMICACLMTLRPLLAKTMPRLFTNSNRSQSEDPSSNKSWAARMGLHGDNKRWGSGHGGLELESQENFHGVEHMDGQKVNGVQVWVGDRTNDVDMGEAQARRDRLDGYGGSY